MFTHRAAPVSLICTAFILMALAAYCTRSGNASVPDPRYEQVVKDPRGKQLLDRYARHAWRVESVTASDDLSKRLIVLSCEGSMISFHVDKSFPLYSQPFQSMDWERIVPDHIVHFRITPTTYDPALSDEHYLQPVDGK
jgi:hypothetical protein